VTRPQFAWVACALLGIACAERGAQIFSVPERSARSVMAASELSVLYQARVITGVPGAVTFGELDGRSALYLKFSDAWRRAGVPLRGFLTLEPRAGETPNAEPVTLEVWRVHGAWRADTLRAWSDKPELALPYSRAHSSSSKGAPLRIEITDLLRFMAEHPALDYGMAVIARGGGGHGASFATGMSEGAGPRLDVYTR
jgi:hypothetical protein